MPTIHDVNKKAPPIVSLPLLPLPGFHQVCLLFYKKYFINLPLLGSDYCKNNAFIVQTLSYNGVGEMENS